MDYIDRLVQNPTFDKLTEPVALYFSYVDTAKFDYYQKNPDQVIKLSNACKKELVEYLQSRKYEAVADDNILAAHPATIVVSNSGIQTPFLPPEEALDFGIALARVIEKSGFAKPLSKIFAIRLQQLPPPVISQESEVTMFSHLRHPDKGTVDYIKYRYGHDFIDRMHNEAWKNGEDNEPLKKHFFDPQNLDEDLFSGRKFATEPFCSYARNDLECKYEVFATPQYVHAAKFCGGDDNKFGLIHHFKKSFQQPYFRNYALEMNLPPEKDPKEQVETVVVPGINDYLGLELYMGSRSFKIPDDREEWVVFKEFLRASYIPYNNILKQRRLNILQDAKENDNQAVTYIPGNMNLKDLLLDKYNNRAEKELSLEDVLISEPTSIRKEYRDFCNSINNMKQTVQNILGKDQLSKSSVSEQLETKLPNGAKIQKSQDR